MQDDNAAAIGRRTLGRDRLGMPRLDAFRSPFMIEVDDAIDIATLTDAEWNDPVDLALDWLHDPVRAGHVPAPLHELAVRAMAVAASYRDELELTTRTMGHGWQSTGSIDLPQLEQLTTRMELLHRFCVALRALLDAATDAAGDASCERLEQALLGTTTPEAFPALVASLERTDG